MISAWGVEHGAEIAKSMLPHNHLSRYVSISTMSPAQRMRVRENVENARLARKYMGPKKSRKLFDPEFHLAVAQNRTWREIASEPQR